MIVARPEPDKPLVVAPLPATGPERLPHTFEPTSYAARLRIDPAQPAFDGTIAITGELAEPSALIWLNAEELVISDVVAAHGNQRIRLRATSMANGLLALQSEQPLAAGRWTISIAFAGSWNDRDAWGGFRQPKSGNPRDRDAERYVFTQFEPDYARKVFPCFDEPDRKVPWQLTLDVPAALVAASNTPIESEAQTRGLKTVRFATTPKLPSYLVAFAVGPFDVVDAGASASGVPVRILTPRGDGKLAAHAATSAPQQLDKLERWLGVPFPFTKLDFVAVPRTSDWWGAMENPGLVTFDTRALRDPKMFDGFAIHELAHHWFGDLVTLAWWDDIWLNESFAYWIGYKLAGDTQWDAPLPETPLVIPNVRGPRAGLGTSIAYYSAAHSAVRKGARFLGVLEASIGEDTLLSALRQYLAAHAHGTARTSDLRRVLAEVAGEPMAALLDRYAHSPTEPLAFELDCTTKSKHVDVTGFTTTGLVCFSYDRDGTRAERCGALAWGAASVELPAKRCPRWVLPRAAHEITMSVVQLDAIRDHAWPLLTDEERTVMIGQVLRNDPTTERLQLSFIAKAASSPDEVTLSWITNYLLRMDRLVAPAQRARYEAWVSNLFGDRARAFGVVREPNAEKRAAMNPLLSLALSVRHREFVQDALTLLPTLDQLDAPARVLVLRAAIADKPSVAEDLIAELPKASPDRMADIGFALEFAPDLLDVMMKHTDQIKLLHYQQKRRLFARLCDETRRADVEQLSRDVFPKPEPGVLLDFKWCIKQRKALEPELRAFFAGPGGAGKPPPVRR